MSNKYLSCCKKFHSSFITCRFFCCFFSFLYVLVASLPNKYIKKGLYTGAWEWYTFKVTMLVKRSILFLVGSWSFLCDMTLESGARCHENRNTVIQCDVTVQVGTIRVTESLAYLHVCHRACDAFSLPNSTANIVNITGLFIRYAIL